ncbi:MAG: ABC transporter substrate-binding protein [Proteobacteria bacterium]|nr:ABC transporter substrate-binding protein [Pseudomonadota bacterium]
MLTAKKLLAGAALAIPLAVGACDTSKVSIATHAKLEYLDPIWTTSYITRNHGYLVYDTLFAYDQNFEPKPQMVESYTTSPDGKTWTFKLRPGLKWHDGTEVTAEDCVVSLQRWSKRDGTGQELFKSVQSLTAPDSKTIVMQLSQPSGIVLEALAKNSANVPFMMPKRIAETDPYTPITDPIGSGPYKFESNKFVPGSQAYYIKNTDYVPRSDKPSLAAGGKIAKASEIGMIYYADPKAAGDALLKDDVQYIESPPSRVVTQLIGKDHIIVANTDPLGNVAMMRFNSQEAPFNNPGVRRAVLMTINQNEYMRTALGDPRFYRVCYSIFPCGTPFANDAGSDILRTADLEAAKKALRAAGYNGAKVVVLNPTDIPVIAAFTAVTVDNLRKIGMNVEVRDMSFQAMMKERTVKGPPTQGGWSMFHTWWLAGDVYDPMDIAFSANPANGWAGAPNDPEVEKLRLEFAKAKNLEQQKEIAAKVQARLLAIGALGTLGQFFEPVAFRDNLAGITSPIQFYWTLERMRKPDRNTLEIPGQIQGQVNNEWYGYW